ncbi:hypothetical protein [Treponema brennaborense]|uniref:Histidine kinase N-terminal 7TM region domain-containing protein n=1 Tax=Treponema brennaborense (strain DSM 12168 / CIP 105900 / DD5/3) TaxID=906968 RepID=F4LP26_TREBD|nr:hypothetical protein [Treponema brennaborense]AEE15902.1 hypothetical protein Trebr_0458 [Treponema brennaborense DSM 12168]
MQYSFIHSAVQIVISVLGLSGASGCLYSVYKMEPSREQNLIMLLSSFVAVVWVSCVIYNSGISVEVEILGVEILIFCSGFIYELIAFIFCSICSLRIPKMCWVILTCGNVFEIILGWVFKYNGVYYGVSTLFGFGSIGNLFKSDFSLNYDMLIVTLIIYAIVFSALFVYKIISDKNRSVFEILLFYVSIMFSAGIYFLLRFCFKNVILLTPIAAGLLITELSFIYLIKKGSLFDIHKFAFEKIMQTIDDGIIILDSSYTVRYMNNIAKRVYDQYMTFNNSMCFDKQQVDMLIADTEQQKQFLFLKIFPENYLKCNDRCYYEQAFTLADERKKNADT